VIARDRLRAVIGVHEKGVKQMLEKLYSPQDLSEKIGKSAVTLRRWRSAGKGPKWMVVERSIRYRESDIVEWLRSLEDQEEGTTNQ
jgi:hypothetical protein